MEKTVKHFCTTAKRIRKDAVEFAKQATMIAGMSAMVVTKMELQRLKEKLPNISIRYTGTWKDSLKFGVGMATTAAGIILVLLGGGSEVISAGASTAVSVPAAASGIAIAGTGLAISGSALANMFDVRIQKSESNKGSESGKNGSDTSAGLNKGEKGTRIPVKDRVTAENGLDYQSNPKHTLGQVGNRPNAGIESQNSLDLFNKSVESSKQPGVRFAYDESTGTLHRFADSNDGSWHWNGSTNQGNNSLKSSQVPIDIIRKFNLPKKGW